jgi:hypothetical protein
MESRPRNHRIGIDREQANPYGNNPVHRPHWMTPIHRHSAQTHCTNIDTPLKILPLIGSDATWGMDGLRAKML